MNANQTSPQMSEGRKPATDRADIEQNKKMVNQEEFIAQSILKGKEQMRKLVKDNNVAEFTLFMYECLHTGRVQPHINMTTANMYDLW
ncbi:hypothetical protein CR513_06844, partial [Mucuna pruriens]